MELNDKGGIDWDKAHLWGDEYVEELQKKIGSCHTCEKYVGEGIFTIVRAFTDWDGNIQVVGFCSKECLSGWSKNIGIQCAVCNEPVHLDKGHAQHIKEVDGKPVLFSICSKKCYAKYEK